MATAAAHGHGRRKGLLRTPAAKRTLARLAGWLLRALGATWRVSIEGPNPTVGPHARTVVGAIWHRDFLIVAYVFRDRGFGVPVSRSRDGDLITDVLLRLGFADSPRGSSSRGGAAALRALVRLVRSGTTIAIPTDGPLGPARVSKSGVAALTRVTAVPMAPLTCSARPCIRFRSWDGTLLPLPFARVVCAFEPTREIDTDATPAEEERFCLELDASLNRLTDALDDRLGLHDVNRTRLAR